MVVESSKASSGDTAYTWVWGAGETPLVHTVSTGPNGRVVQTYSWDLSKNKLLAQFTRGRTNGYPIGGSPGGQLSWARVIGTFYRTTPLCGAGAGVADAQERVVVFLFQFFVA